MRRDVSIGQRYREYFSQPRPDREWEVVSLADPIDPDADPNDKGDLLWNVRCIRTGGMDTIYGCNLMDDDCYLLLQDNRR